MSFHRTPPKQSTMSATDTESIDGSVSDNLNTAHTNISTSRLKRKRETEMSQFMSEVRAMFEDFVTQQNNKLQKLESSLSEIKKQNEGINTSLAALSDKYDDIQKELESLKLERKEHCVYIKNLEDKIENFEKQSCMTKLEIRNVPRLNNETKENLCNAVIKIGKIFNMPLQTSSIRDIYRPFVKSDVAKPIIVEFTSVLTKESVMNNLKKLTLQEKKDKLNTSIFDLEGPQKPIFISDYLTPKGRRLFFLARDFASTHNYAFCWTSFGKIYLRMKEGMQHIRVDEEADLNKLKKMTTE